MPRFRIALLLLFFSVNGLFAQDISLNVNGGYLFGDRFKISGGKAQILGNWAFMGTAGVEIGNGRSAELSYLWQETRGKADLYAQQVNLEEAIQMHYILVGASQYQDLGEGFSVGGGAKMGLMVLAPRKQSLEDIVKLAFGVQGGMKYMFSPGMGVQFSANLFFPVTDVGGYLWWSPGSGTQAAISSRIPFAQFGLFGGLIVKPTQLSY